LLSYRATLRIAIFPQQCRQKRATEKRKKWREKTWWKRTRECVRKNNWATTQRKRAQKRIYSEEGVKGIDAGSQIVEISGSLASAVLIARQNQRYMAVWNQRFVERRTNFRDFLPSNRTRWKVARRISPDLWMKLAHRQIRCSAFPKDDVIKR